MLNKTRATAVLMPFAQLAAPPRGEQVFAGDRAVIVSATKTF